MKLLVGVFLVLVLILGIYFYFDTSDSVCVNKTCFEVTIADSSSERSRGLMYVEDLDELDGMFFVYPESGNYSFWMKNTLIPLDIIWINGDFEIVYIEKNASPCVDVCDSYSSDKEAKYVLEINGGLSDKFGFGVGDVVSLNLKN